jgi:hypothetical protein
MKFLSKFWQKKETPVLDPQPYLFDTDVTCYKVSSPNYIKSDPEKPLFVFPSRDTDKPMWELKDGAEIAKILKEPIWQIGFAIALTGGAVYRGYSDKDLDLLFYPLEAPYNDYVSVINYCLKAFEVEDFFVIQHKQKKSQKIVAVLKLKDDRRIDLLFPTITGEQRRDSFKTIWRDYKEEPFRAAMLDIIST